MKWDQIHTAEEMEDALDREIQNTRVHRFRIRLIDALGAPLRGLSIRAVHKNHDFVFGVCPNGHISMTNRLACGESRDAEVYWERIGDVFNATTLWWGWKILEPDQAVWTFDGEVHGFGPMERMVERAELLNHRITAHAILYPREDLSPQWLSSCGEQEAFRALEEHVKKTVDRYKNRISCWHPVNEAYHDIQQVGGLRIKEGIVYRWIGDMAPHADLVDNGGYTIDLDFYKKGIESAEHFGGRVDDLGVRGYFELYNSEALSFYRSLWEHYGNLADRYGKGVRMTEIGATSAPRKGAYSPWDVDPSTAQQLGISNFEEYREGQPITEETQATFLIRMYKLAFAHPAVKECSYWDICDTYTWNQVEGGILRADLSPKPAYEQLKTLIRDTWNTQTDAESDADGLCTFSGFDGEYEITLRGESFRLHLNEGTPDQVLCVG